MYKYARIWFGDFEIEFLDERCEFLVPAPRCACFNQYKLFTNLHTRPLSSSYPIGSCTRFLLDHHSTMPFSHLFQCHSFRRRYCQNSSNWRKFYNRTVHFFIIDPTFLHKASHHKAYLVSIYTTIRILFGLKIHRLSITFWLIGSSINSTFDCQRASRIPCPLLLSIVCDPLIPLPACTLLALHRLPALHVTYLCTVTMIIICMYIASILQAFIYDILRVEITPRAIF